MTATTRILRGLALLALTAAAACSKDSSGPGSSNQLVGAWVATKWEFTNQANTSQKEDLVAGGVTVTLTINASTYSIAFTAPGVPSQSISGTWTQSGSNFTITETGSASSETIAFTFSNNNNTLTMSSLDTNWDFDGDGIDEAATLAMIFTRQ